jgi:hypothetical protein
VFSRSKPVLAEARIDRIEDLCGQIELFQKNRRSFSIVVSSGIASSFGSSPTNLRIDSISYLASSITGSLNVHHCGMRWIRRRSLAEAAFGGRPWRLEVGAGGLDQHLQHFPRHHLVRLAQNCSDRVGFFFDSKLRDVNERCFSGVGLPGDCWL